MPSKATKKKTVAEFSSEPVIKNAQASPSVHHVVEVVEEDKVPDALETIKENAKEIEDAVEEIEEDVHEFIAPGIQADEKKKEEVDSLFVTQQSEGISPEITVVGKRDTSLGIWVGAMLGIALAVGVSLIVLVRGPQTLSFSKLKPIPSPTIAVVPTTVPAAPERKDVQIKVINGGGVVGAGSKMKAFLEEKGYTVVEVGNASAYTYTSTEIVVKTSQQAKATLLTNDLKADYSLGSTSTTLADSASYDAEVIVGKE